MKGYQIFTAKRLVLALSLWLGAATAVALSDDARILQIQSFRNQNLDAYPDLNELVQSSWSITGFKAYPALRGIAFVPESKLVQHSGFQGLTCKRNWPFRFPFFSFYSDVY